MLPERLGSIFEPVGKLGLGLHHRRAKPQADGRRVAAEAALVGERAKHPGEPAAQGMYVGYGGIPNAELPPAGRQFLEERKASGGKPGPNLSAVYAAQAAEILLDAIARSVQGAGRRPRDHGPRHLSLSRPGAAFAPPLGSGTAPLRIGDTPRFLGCPA